jgi:hypothetical protein
MSNRYVTTSEKSVMLLEGALLWGRLQDAQPNSLAYTRAERAWLDWQEGKVSLVVTVQRIQRSAFDLAQRL